MERLNNGTGKTQDDPILIIEYYVVDTYKHGVQVDWTHLFHVGDK